MAKAVMAKARARASRKEFKFSDRRVRRLAGLSRRKSAIGEPI